MAKIQKRIIFLAAGFLFLVAPSAHAANLYFSPLSGSSVQGENFTVRVLVNAEESINAVSGALTFPTEYLEIISVNSINSIIDLWVQRPTFSNAGSLGNAHFEGVILNPGFRGTNGRIVEVLFGIKKQGTASVSMSEFAILANDGIGTNIAIGDGDATFVFTQPVSPQKKEESKLDSKIRDIEKRVKEIEVRVPPEPLIIVQEPKLQREGLIGVWEVLPGWIKIVATLLIGAAAVLLLLAVVSLGIIIIIWGWSLLWSKRNRLGYYYRRLRRFLGMAERELEGDIRYGAYQLRREIREAQTHPPFKQLLKDYGVAFCKVVKRFFTKNEYSGSRSIDEEKDEKC